MSWQTVVRPVVEEVIRTRAVPGVVIAVAHGDDEPDYLVVGADGADRLLTVDSLFPVASITKPATALVILRLVARGMLKLDDPLARYLPEAAATVDGVTFRRLLCHTAGLPDDVAGEAAPYTAALDWPTLAKACLTTPLIAPPGTTLRYSNVGPGLVAIVVERLTGKPIQQAIDDLVLAPLGIEGYLGVEPPREPAHIAGAFGRHAGTETEPFNSPFWRALAMPWGGLVTTAAGALALVRVFAGTSSDFLPSQLLAEAISDQSGGLAGTMLGLPWQPAPWGLGVELRGTKDPHWAPASVSSGSFGHAGASGCLAWVDPVAEVSWAMLGTRTFDVWWPAWAGLGEAILAAPTD